MVATTDRSSILKLPGLVPDEFEWNEFAGQYSWAIVVVADASRLPGLAKARDAVASLPVLVHPNHYLHCTLRALGPAGAADEATLEAIASTIAQTSRWTAQVRGIKAFPTAIWADPDPDTDHKLMALVDSLLAPIGSLPESPQRASTVPHITIAYSEGTVGSGVVNEALGPLRDLEVGEFEIFEAVLAELHMNTPYPRWTIRRHFPFGA